MIALGQEPPLGGSTGRARACRPGSRSPPDRPPGQLEDEVLAQLGMEHAEDLGLAPSSSISITRYLPIRDSGSAPRPGSSAGAAPVCGAVLRARGFDSAGDQPADRIAIARCRSGVRALLARPGPSIGDSRPSSDDSGPRRSGSCEPHRRRPRLLEPVQPVQDIEVSGDASSREDPDRSAIAASRAPTAVADPPSTRPAARSTAGSERSSSGSSWSDGWRSIMTRPSRSRGTAAGPRRSSARPAPPATGAGSAICPGSAPWNRCTPMTSCWRVPNPHRVISSSNCMASPTRRTARQ